MVEAHITNNGKERKVSLYQRGSGFAEPFRVYSTSESIEEINAYLAKLYPDCEIKEMDSVRLEKLKAKNEGKTLYRVTGWNPTTQETTNIGLFLAVTKEAAIKAAQRRKNTAKLVLEAYVKTGSVA